jgi:hypothetical protein
MCCRLSVVVLATSAWSLGCTSTSGKVAATSRPPPPTSEASGPSEPPVGNGHSARVGTWNVVQSGSASAVFPTWRLWQAQSFDSGLCQVLETGDPQVVPSLTALDTDSSCAPPAVFGQRSQEGAYLFGSKAGAVGTAKAFFGYTAAGATAVTANLADGTTMSVPVITNSFVIISRSGSVLARIAVSGSNGQTLASCVVSSAGASC